LILIGLAIILYALMLIIRNVNVTIPKYRLEFVNGETQVISINPEIRNDYNYKKLLEEIYKPSPSLIEKRIREFIKAENIKSALKEAKCINSNQIYISQLCTNFIRTNFILKVLIIYLILLIIRFFLWALRVLVREEGEINKR